MTVFIGLDLAWTGRYPSGLCVLEGGTGHLVLRRLECMNGTPQEFAGLLHRFGTDVVAAVDAPLVRTAACVAERQLARVFGRFHASAYTASPDFLRRKGLTAGPDLGLELRSRGFNLDPLRLGANATGRHALEVYPHAAHIVHFNLARRLGYKKGTIAARLAEFTGYQAHLAGLSARAFAPAEIPPGLTAALGAFPGLPSALRLKDREDLLDSVTCAFMAYEAWQHGLYPCEVFGDAVNGHIAVPGLARDPRFQRPAGTSGKASSP